MCPKLRHILCAVVASGACECSTPSHAACWGSTPDPLEHDSHAAVHVCVSNAAQGQPHSYCPIKGLGLLPNKQVFGFGYTKTLLAATELSVFYHTSQQHLLRSRLIGLTISSG